MSAVARLAHSPAFNGVLLGLFAFASAVMLASADRGTADAIAERRAEDLRASITQVIPPALHDNNMLAAPLLTKDAKGTPITVYQARRDGRVVAVAFEHTGQGYGGAIRVIMGIAASGEVLGVRVLQHAETPGLGDKIEEAKSDWIRGFAGTSLRDPAPEHWGVKKDGGRFDQFSGATITPRAVVAAVKAGLDFFAANTPALLTPAAAGTSPTESPS